MHVGGGTLHPHEGGIQRREALLHLSPSSSPSAELHTAVQLGGGYHTTRRPDPADVSICDREMYPACAAWPLQSTGPARSTCAPRGRPSCSCAIREAAIRRSKA